MVCEQNSEATDGREAEENAEFGFSCIYIIYVYTYICILDYNEIILL